MFPADFKELFSIFNSRKVKYLLIGGYAVSLHAQPRATKDLDLLVSPAAGNAKALYKALREFGMPLGELRPRDFMKPNLYFRMGQAPLMVDIFSAIRGVDFRDAWNRRIEIETDPISGLKAFVISSSDLIAAKVAAARPQDLADVAALREAEKQIARRRRKKKP